MLENEIKFIASDREFVEVWPHPKPSSRFIPEDYKKLEKFTNGNMHDETIKGCIPFLDALTAGYIIPFDQDYLIDPADETFTITPANREQQDTGYHDSVQLPESWQKKTGSAAGKFINKWLIKTPPGYSCYFVKPMNRVEDRFDIISGVVDTDTYINLIHFPFILNKKDEQFLIKKGQPMIQVIPFRRESWKSWSGFYYEPLHNKTLNSLLSHFYDKYKKLFWRKKSYK